MIKGDIRQYELANIQG